MSDTVFKVGDIVRYELGASMNGAPRWDHGNDGGETGIFEKGKVISTDKLEFDIQLETTEEFSQWNFTMNDRQNPGFPKLDATHAKNINALEQWMNG